MKRQHGFTLIELLIVIALLGALAVGLLATVDPFEQLKKGTDTSRRNTTSEVYNAMIRYYSVKNSFPWGGALAQPYTLDLPDMSTWIDQVASAGELKRDFMRLAGTDNLAKIYVSSSIDGAGTIANTISVCFSPESKSFKREQNTKYESNGEATAGCLAEDPTSGSDDCYWCIK